MSKSRYDELKKIPYFRIRQLPAGHWRASTDKGYFQGADIDEVYAKYEAAESQGAEGLAIKPEGPN